MSADHNLERYGYQQQLGRSLSSFTSFAVGFSFISITSGIFASYGFALNNSGPRGIWLWILAGIGQILVALIFMQFAARIPIAGYSYQWASRLLNPRVGWGFGWLSYAFLAVVVVAVDYGFATQAFMPLFGIAPSVGNAQLVTVCTLAAQALLIVVSTRATALINGSAVGAEIIGMLGLTVVLLVAALVTGDGSVSNLTSTGTIDGGAGYWAYNGPFFLATLVGAYTIVGFESAANLAEETEEPTKVVPMAMLRAVTVSVVVGLVFLIALTIAMTDVKATTGSPAPVSFIMEDQLGSTIKDLFLVVVNVAIFANGLIIMMSGSRLVFAMSRDRRFPGFQLFGRVTHSTSTPAWAVALIMVGGVIFTLVFSTDALFKLFTAGSILPALIYLATVLMYLKVRPKLKLIPATFSLGRWEPFVVAGALLWLIFELTVLLFPSQFWDAVKLVIVLVAIGGVTFLGFRIFSPDALDDMPESALGEVEAPEPVHA
ncbi:APC family permease [Solirubrobacter soli]|uniref:APC family permease n=1 Tax=Solirubrobacter soli TaxID=363832 RepID=UPI00040AFEA8|nr:amino acid permease [Solirubrobacter soli]